MSPTATTDTIEQELEHHRVELTAYCYRMLGSGSEAEDAVQETLTRAWRSFDRFEGRASVRWTLGPKSKRPELAAAVTGTKVTSTLTLSPRR